LKAFTTELRKTRKIIIWYDFYLNWFFYPLKGLHYLFLIELKRRNSVNSKFITSCT
jgi:hypothetical protein